MKNSGHSRRDFLKSSGALAGGSWLTLNTSVLFAVAQAACGRRDAESAWLNLADHEADGFAAVAEQIIPGGEDGPGAGDAGVVYFIDVAVGDFMAGALPMLREGLAALDGEAGGSFAGLPFDRQTELLEAVESGPFFQAMLFLTQAGMFAMPAHGGNRDHAGWRLIGFDHRHAWQPPFGYYDAQYATGGGDHDE